MTVNLSENNCTECKRYVKPKNNKIMLTVVLLKTEQEVRYLCKKCLAKFKELTKDTKVALEIDPTSLEATVFYCYRCELKTKDKEYFKKHDCIKTKFEIDFLRTLDIGGVDK